MSDQIDLQQDTNDLQEIVNNSWNGIGIINADTKFIYLNNAFSPLLGYTNEELLKLKFIDLITDNFKDEFKQLIIKNHKNRYINNMQLSCIRKDGALVFLNITISIMKNKKYIVIDASDITQTVSENQIFDKYLIQAVIDENGNIISASEAYTRLLGYSEDELKGKPFLIDQDDISKEKLWQKIISEKEEYSGTIKCFTKKGKYLWFETVIKPKFNKYGDILGYTAVMFDITNEMTLEENKKVLQREITDKDAKLSIMTETMRLVAHEWRQPLNTISLEAQNLMLKYEFEDEVPTSESIKNLQLIVNRIDELSKIINNFQYTTEMHEEKIETTTDELIKHAIDYSKLEESEITIQNDYPQPIRTFKTNLSKSLANILNNAKEAIKRANPDPKLILFKVFKENNNLIIEILNNGGNIPDNILENIFTPYFSTKPEKNGVGLSLYNCKTIIELHLKGSLEAINVDDDKVKFKITIPMEQLI